MTFKQTIPSYFQQTAQGDTPIGPLHTSLVILSLLRLVESSTTTSTPDLLLMVLLLLQHLSALAVVLLNSELCVTFRACTYSGQTVLGLELLDVIQGVVDQSKSSGSAATYSVTLPMIQVPKATRNPNRMMHLSSWTLYFLARVAFSSSFDTEARLGWTTSIVYKYTTDTTPHHLTTLQQRISHKLSHTDSNSSFGHRKTSVVTIS